MTSELNHVEDLYEIRQIADLAILENTDYGHDKVYIILVVETPGGSRRLVRFWGRHGNRLQCKAERCVGHEFDAIVDAKIEKGYYPVSSDEYSNSRYVEYIRQIDEELDYVLRN